MGFLKIKDTPKVEFYKSFLKSTPSELPNEILYSIISHAINQSTDGLDTIRSLSLVSKDFKFMTDELVKKIKNKFEYPKYKKYISEKNLSINQVNTSDPLVLKSLSTVDPNFTSLKIQVEKAAICTTKLSLLKPFKNLKSLNIKVGPIICFDDEMVKKIVQFCPNLNKLKLERCNEIPLEISENSFKDLVNLTKLENLKIKNASISDCELFNDIVFPELKKLDLDSENLKSSIFNTAATFPNLREIKINHIRPNYEDFENDIDSFNPLHKFPKFSKLHSADFSDCESVLFIDVLCEENLFGIKSLAIRTDVINDNYERSLDLTSSNLFELNNNFKSLENLKLNLINEGIFNYPSCNFLKTLSSHPMLKHLTLSNASLDNTILNEIFECKNINHLTFENIDFVNNEIETFQENYSIKKLTFSHSENKNDYITLFPMHLMTPAVKTLVFKNCFSNIENLIKNFGKTIRKLNQLHSIVLDEGKKTQKIYLLEELRDLIKKYHSRRNKRASLCFSDGCTS